MILRSLYEYYHRKAADPDPARRLPVFGRELKEIPFVLELTHDGRLAGIQDTRTVDGKRKIGSRYLVPKAVKKSSGIAANLLWDNAEYVLALPDPKKLADMEAKGKGPNYLSRLSQMQTAFRARLHELPETARADAGVEAVIAFLGASPAAQVMAKSVGAEIAASNPVLSFRLVDDPSLDLVCQRPALALLDLQDADDEDVSADEATSLSMCLVTGETVRPVRLHTAIKGVWGAQTSGANIVSFNLDAFNSHGKTQGANAPVGHAAEFAYTTALNHLLQKGSRQRAQVGSASTVFWAQADDDGDVEEWAAALVNDDPDDPDRHVEQIRALYDSVHHTGRFDGGRGENRFFVLGLGPNAARIAVRFWYAAPVVEVAQRIRQWFDDIDIDRAPYERPHPALRRMLAATCLATGERPGGDIDRLPATIEGDTLRAIFLGTELPALLLHGALRRCRADPSRITALRAGLIKAGINRSLRAPTHHRAHDSSRRELKMSLDKDNLDPPYLLGRLFAVFERVQEIAADRDLNRSIRDAYFGAAMASPRSAFPRLIQLHQFHLRDVKRSRFATGRYFEALVAEINDKFDAKRAFDRPVVGLRDQGLFTIGYYQQRHDFFHKSGKPSEVVPADGGATEPNAETLSTAN